jgi:hypothetical protein
MLLLAFSLNNLVPVVVSGLILIVLQVCVSALTSVAALKLEHHQHHQGPEENYYCYNGMATYNNIIYNQ